MPTVVFLEYGTVVGQGIATPRYRAKTELHT